MIIQCVRQVILLNKAIDKQLFVKNFCILFTTRNLFEIIVLIYSTYFLFIFCRQQSMNGLRKFQFFVKGYFNFTKKDQPLPPLQGTLKGKNFVITGANSGIGYEAAKEAAKRLANVYLLCRDQKRGEAARQKIQQQSSNDNVYLVLCELGQVESMNQAVAQLRKTLNQIDVLVHNGGCMLHQKQYTKEKIQKNFATNTFAVYYLTNLCLDLLNKSSRTITVSSGGCLTQPLIIEDIFMETQDFDGTVQYARNKRQQLCLMEEFGKLYPQKGLFVSMHPGWSDTPSVREAMPEFYQKMKDKLKTAEEGADTIVWLSLCKEQLLSNGKFYFDREKADKHLLISCTSYSQKQADTLMSRLKNMGKV